jgi:phasin family protein
MFTNPEQFANATKTLFELQMQTFNSLTSKAVQGVEQVVALNMATAKNSLEGSIAAGRELTQARDPRAALAALTSQIQPGVEGASAYREQLRALVDEIQNDFRQAADAHVAEAKSTLSALIYDVTQNVKPGQENAVEIIKSAIDNAFQGYEKVTQATRQAVQQVEEQIAKATEQMTQAAKQAGQAAQSAQTSQAPQSDQSGQSTQGMQGDQGTQNAKGAQSTKGAASTTK